MEATHNVELLMGKLLNASVHLNIHLVIQQLNVRRKEVSLIVELKDVVKMQNVLESKRSLFADACQEHRDVQKLSVDETWNVTVT